MNLPQKGIVLKDFKTERDLFKSTAGKKPINLTPLALSELEQGLIQMKSACSSARSHGPAKPKRKQTHDVVRPEPSSDALIELAARTKTLLNTSNGRKSTQAAPQPVGKQTLVVDLRPGEPVRSVLFPSSQLRANSYSPRIALQSKFFKPPTEEAKELVDRLSGAGGLRRQQV